MIKTNYAPAQASMCSADHLFGEVLFNKVDKNVRLMAGKFWSILSDEDVEDLVHDTYLGILENKSKVDLSKNFYGWVYRICQNAVNKCAKAKSQRNGWILEIDEKFDDDDDDSIDIDHTSIMIDETFAADRETLEAEFNERFQAAVSRMKGENREIVEMLIDGMSYDIMAERLGCSEGALRVKVCRIRKELEKARIGA
jgi:RNA polymerase sigma factor (sigma-70 family)